MEARIERDELERELKRIHRDIQAILDEREEDLADFSNREVMLNELLKASTTEFKATVTTRWDLPLPIPIELETEDKLDELLQVSEETFHGLKLNIIRKVENDAWELSGSAGNVEFTVEFKTQQKQGKTSIKSFELKKIPHECASEVTPLMELARSRSCVRTWLVGIAEYAYLVKERDEVFGKIRRDAPPGSCRPIERRIQSHLDFTSRNGEKSIRLLWRAEWTVLPDINEPNEFLTPRCELVALRGFDEQVEMLIEDTDSFSGLVRQHGLAHAAVLLIQKLYQ